MSDIKLINTKKYINELLNIVNMDKVTKEQINELKRIINLYFIPDRVLFAYNKIVSAGILKLAGLPLLFNFPNKRDGSGLCAYKMSLSLSSSEIIAFATARTAKTLSVAEDRALGCMLGMAIGDSLGAPLEFMDYRPGGLPVITTGLGEFISTPLNNFNVKPGQWTDDTSMGLCLADSLLATNFKLDQLDLMLRFVAWWDYGYNNAFLADDTRFNKHSIGLGGNIRDSLSAFKNPSHGNAVTVAGDKNTSGNGTIMRLAAVPILYYTDEIEAAETARNQSYTTHQGTEAAECAALMAIIIVRAINASGTPEERKNAVLNSLDNYECSNCPTVQNLARSEAEPGGNINRDWRWKRKPVGAHSFAPERIRQHPGYVGSYVMDALAMALHCVYATNDAKEAMLLAANTCGDADTVAAITGQIAGAIYGASTIPEKWISCVEEWDGGGRIAQLAYSLFHRKPAIRD
jgi:ADP-ribosylglycohydrolase